MDICCPGSNRRKTNGNNNKNRPSTSSIIPVGNNDDGIKTAEGISVRSEEHVPREKR